MSSSSSISASSFAANTYLSLNLEEKQALSSLPDRIVSIFEIGLMARLEAIQSEHNDLNARISTMFPNLEAAAENAANNLFFAKDRLTQLQQQIAQCNPNQPDFDYQLATLGQQITDGAGKLTPLIDKHNELTGRLTAKAQFSNQLSQLSQTTQHLQQIQQFLNNRKRSWDQASASEPTGLAPAHLDKKPALNPEDASPSQSTSSSSAPDPLQRQVSVFSPLSSRPRAISSAVTTAQVAHPPLAATPSPNHIFSPLNSRNTSANFFPPNFPFSDDAHQDFLIELQNSNINTTTVPSVFSDTHTLEQRQNYISGETTGYNVFHYLARSGQLNIIDDIRKGRPNLRPEINIYAKLTPESFTARTPGGLNVLHIFAYNHLRKLTPFQIRTFIEYAMTHGIGIDDVDETGKSALDYAVEELKLPVVIELLALGAKQRKNNLTCLPIHILTSNQYASKNSEIEALHILRKLIENDKEIVNEAFNGASPLIMASTAHNFFLAECLLINNANVNSVDSEGKDAIHHTNIPQNRNTRRTPVQEKLLALLQEYKNKMQE